MHKTGSNGRLSIDSLSGYGYSQQFVPKFSKDFPVVYCK
jgi:hypothetical protein